MRIRNSEAYFKAVGRMDEIRQYCDDNNINDFETLVEKIVIEKPEWINTINRAGTIAALGRYFNRKETRQKHKEVMSKEPPNNRRPKSVICLDNGKEFKSINAATRWLGIQHSQMVSDCCRGVISNVRGYRFAFKEDLDKSETE